MVRVAGAPWPAGGGGMVGGHDGGDRHGASSAAALTAGTRRVGPLLPPTPPPPPPVHTHMHKEWGRDAWLASATGAQVQTRPHPPPAATPEGGRRLGGGPSAPRRRRAHAKPGRHARGGTRAAAGRGQHASRARGTLGRLQAGEVGVVPPPRRGHWTGGGVGAARGSGVGGGAARRDRVAARPLVVAWAGRAGGLAGGGVWAAADEARSALPGRETDSCQRERGGPTGARPKIHASDTQSLLQL